MHRLCRLTVLVLLAMLAGCGGPDVPPRDYVFTLYDARQQPLLEAEVAYLGKTAPPGARVAHDWRRQDTDFYRTTLRNLSDRTIELQAIRYAVAQGPLYSPPLKDRAGIAADYGSATLAPGQMVRDHDSYVWAREDGNVLQRTLQLTVDGTEQTAALPLLYRH